MFKYLYNNLIFKKRRKDLRNKAQDAEIILWSYLKGKHVAIMAYQAPQLALDVLLRDKTWERAIEEDWRSKKVWQPGWEYVIK